MPVSSVQIVLAIPELVEQILLYLDHKTLLLAQRVNCLFRNTTLLHSLQRRLFLYLDLHYNEIQINPILGEFSHCFSSSQPVDLGKPTPAQAV